MVVQLMSHTVLHIGLHKTATTTLQQQFFPSCSDVNLLTTQNFSVRNFINNVTKTDPAYFDADIARALISPLLSRSTQNIISNESLSCLPFSGVIEPGLDHRTPILNNLKSVFPDAKIILVLRRQDGLAKSLYRQYLKSGGTRPVERFYGTKGVNKPALVSINRFLYLKYVDVLFNAFNSNVLLLPFELFVEDQTEFLKRITDFIGIELPNIELKPENATKLNPAMLEVTRLINHFFRSLLNPAGLLPGLMINKHGNKRRQSPVQFIHDNWPFKNQAKGKIDIITKQILEQAKEDNLMLDEKYALNLQHYGYY